MQVWRTAVKPKRGSVWMGTRPLVHTGFYAAWTSKGLDVQILGHLRVGACRQRDELNLHSGLLRT